MAETNLQYIYNFSRASYGNYDAGPTQTIDSVLGNLAALYSGYYASSYTVFFDTFMGSPVSNSRKYNFDIQVFCNGTWYTLHEARDETLYSGGTGQYYYSGKVPISLQELIGKNGITGVRIYVLQDSGGQGWKMRGYKAGTGYVVFDLIEQYQAVDRNIYNPYSISVKDNNNNTIKQTEENSTYPNSRLKICWRIPLDGSYFVQFIDNFKITITQLTTGELIKSLVFDNSTTNTAGLAMNTSNNGYYDYTYTLQDNELIGISGDKQVRVQMQLLGETGFVKNDNNYYNFRIRDFGEPTAINDFKINDKNGTLYIGSANVLGKDITMKWSPSTPGLHTNEVKYRLNINSESIEIPASTDNTSKTGWIKQNGYCVYTYTTPKKQGGTYQDVIGNYSITPIGITPNQNEISGKTSNIIQITHMFENGTAPSFDLGLLMNGNFNTYVTNGFTLQWNSAPKADNRYSVSYRSEIVQYNEQNTTILPIFTKTVENATNLTYTKEELTSLGYNQLYGIRFSIVYTATFLGNQSTVISPFLQFNKVYSLQEGLEYELGSLNNIIKTITNYANLDDTKVNSSHAYKNVHILFELNDFRDENIDDSNVRTIYYNIAYKKGANGDWVNAYADWRQWQWPESVQAQQVSSEINLNELPSSVPKEEIYIKLLLQDDRGSAVEISKMIVDDEAITCSITQISAPQVEINSILDNENTYDGFEVNYTITDSIPESEKSIKFFLKIKSGDEEYRYENPLKIIEYDKRTDFTEQISFEKLLSGPLSSSNSNNDKNFLNVLYSELTENRNPRPSLILELIVSRKEMSECSASKRKEFYYNLERDFSFDNDIIIDTANFSTAGTEDNKKYYTQEGQEIKITIPSLLPNEKTTPSYLRANDSSKQENITYMLYREDKGWEVKESPYIDLAPKAENDIDLRYKVVAKINYKNKTVSYPTGEKTINVARWTDQDRLQVINVEKVYNKDNIPQLQGIIIFPDKLYSSDEYQNLKEAVYQIIYEKDNDRNGIEEIIFDTVTISRENIIKNKYEVSFVVQPREGEEAAYFEGDMPIKIKVTFKNVNTNINPIIKTSQIFLIRASSVPLAIRDGRIGINVSSVNFNKEETAIKNSALKIFSAPNSYVTIENTTPENTTTENTTTENDTTEKVIMEGAPVVEIEADGNITNPIFLRFLHTVSDTTSSKLKTADFYFGSDEKIHCDNFYYPDLNGITGENLTLSFLEQVNTNDSGTIALKISNGKEGDKNSNTIIGKVKGWNKVLCLNDSNILDKTEATFNIGSITAVNANFTTDITAKNANFTTAVTTVDITAEEANFTTMSAGNVSLFTYKPNENAPTANYWRFYLPTPSESSGAKSYEIITTQKLIYRDSLPTDVENYQQGTICLVKRG